MASCEMCGKGPQFGKSVSFSKRRTNRAFYPNVQAVTITVEGRAKKMKLCTRCIRTLNKS
jgi:large subunit ribosomal protein L28